LYFKRPAIARLRLLCPRITLAPLPVDYLRLNPSNSSIVRGQSDPSNRDKLRSAKTFPPVWQRAQ
jgi:hypothetical protein